MTDNKPKVLLYLDIGGVLNKYGLEENIEIFSLTGKDHFYSPSYISNLVTLSNTVNLDVVLISSWAEDFILEELSNLFKNTFNISYNSLSVASVFEDGAWKNPYGRTQYSENTDKRIEHNLNEQTTVNYDYIISISDELLKTTEITNFTVEDGFNQSELLKIIEYMNI